MWGRERLRTREKLDCSQMEIEDFLKSKISAKETLS
jgi:hypothetical protein